ncbi:MAG: hypothetical protein JJ970_15100, partial [Erythrobacter sp.]
SSFQAANSRNPNYQNGPLSGGQVNQTNTIVYAAGGYRFADFLKIGVPMNIVVGLATCLAIDWLIWR